MSIGPGPWLAVSVPYPPPGEELLLVDALRRAGARRVEKQGERFVAYLPAPVNREDLLGGIRAAVGASTSLDRPELCWYWVALEHLAEQWRASFEPRRVSPRLLVAPADHEGGSSAETVVIRLEAGPAFGTGEHPTTRSCLRLFERLHRPGGQIADVGAGSGVLSIAAARLGAWRVIAIESDPLACATARANLALNAVEDRVTLVEEEMTSGRGEMLGRCAGIFANIGTDVVVGLLPTLQRALHPGGWLIVSGMVADEERAVVRAAAAVGLTLTDCEREEGWWTGAFHL